MSRSLIVLVTRQKYINPLNIDWYLGQILEEDRLVTEALEKKGFDVMRVSWDDELYDWSSPKAVIFRAVWDYFERIQEFKNWLKRIENQTTILNQPSLIWWNIDKSYLHDLEAKGVNIPPTLFIKKGTTVNLEQLIRDQGWQEAVMKPNIAGTARETYRVDSSNATQHNAKLNELLQNEDMLVQAFQDSILSKGEISLMVFGGTYTHAIRKRAKAGDFRVQDDFGGTIEVYEPKPDEIEFAISVMRSIDPIPLYGRVDIMWDNDDKLSVSEVEIFEPELWFRNHHPAAEVFARKITEYLN